MEISLKTLPQATEQQVFDHVALHLLNQNERCVELSSFFSQECAYRNEIGLKCAAGCLISDEEYNSEFEYYTYSGLVEDSIAPRNHEILIQRLQDIHDCCDPTDWKIELIKLAKIYKLSFDLIENF